METVTMDPAVKRQLKIKSGVLKRCLKEYDMYKQEVVDGRKQLESMNPAHDRYNQLQQALDESKSMVNDTSNRLLSAKEELQRVIDAEDIASQFKDDELYNEAVGYIEQAGRME